MPSVTPCQVAWYGAAVASPIFSSPWKNSTLAMLAPPAAVASAVTVTCCLSLFAANTWSIVGEVIATSGLGAPARWIEFR